MQEKSISFETLEPIFNEGQKGILVADENSVILYVNKKLCDISEYNKDELIGKTISILLDSSIKEIHRENVKNFLNNGVTTLMATYAKTHLITKTGIKKRLIIYLQKPLYLSDGRKVCISHCREQGNEERDSAIKYLRSVNHDLRNCLNSALLTVESLDENKPASPRFIKSMLTSISYIVEGSLNSLSVDKEAPKSVIRTVETALFFMDLINSSGYQHIKLIAKKNIPIHITIDVGRVCRVFNNLISNSVKANKGFDKEIDVYISEANDHIEIIVCDNGCGIEEKIEKKLFNSDETRPDKEHGIGLVHSKQMARDLNGDLIYLGRTEEYSTSFKFTFEYTNVSTFYGRKRVIIVDDDKTTLCLLKKLLIKKNVEVVTFSDPQDLFDKETVNLSNYNVVITDINMPQMTGGQLIRNLKLNNFQGRIIIITGDDLYTIDNDTRSLGVEMVLNKPINVKVLYEILGI